MSGSRTVAYFDEYSHEIIETICAFLNTNGGKIYMGFKISHPLSNKDFFDTIINHVKLDINEHLQSELKNSIQLYSNHEPIYRQQGRIFPFVIRVPKYQEEYGLSYILINGERSVFFRLKNENLRVRLEDSRYWELVFHHGFPVIESDSEKVINTIDFSVSDEIRSAQNIDLQFIGNLDSLKNLDYIYKYMDLESTLLSLENGTLRFVEPTSWDDQYEGRFYNAEYYDINGNALSSNLTPFLYATCLSTKQDNEAAWILYSHNRKGLASRCVEFKLNFRELINQLFNALSNCAFYIGLVQYKQKGYIDHLHEPTINGKKNNNYYYYFAPFSRNNYLALLTLKRNLFDHEQELRFFIIPNKVKSGVVKTQRGSNGQLSKTPEHKTIVINWAAIIEEVRIDVNCSDYEKSLLQAKLNELKSQRITELNKQSIPFNLNEINSRFTLKDFDPYKDVSLATGPLSITIK